MFDPGAFSPGKFAPAVEIISASSFEPMFDTRVDETFEPSPLPESDQVVSLVQDPQPCGVFFSDVDPVSVPALPSSEDILVVTDNGITKTRMLSLLSCPCFLQVCRILALNGYDRRLCSELAKQSHQCSKCEWCTDIAGNYSSVLRFSQQYTRHPTSFMLPTWKNVPPLDPHLGSRILLSGRLELNRWYLALTRMGDPPTYDTSEYQSRIRKATSDERDYPPVDFGMCRG